ncbi:MAG: hypothetical protein AAF266_02565 [Planctomycetota bacterium]
MSRDAKQLANVALIVMRLAKGKLGAGGVIGLVLLALLYVAVLQPLAESRFGVSLPTIGDVAESTPSPSTVPPATDAEDRSKAPSQTDASELSEVLTSTGRDTYRSTAGLRYTRGSKHGTRLAHVMSHAQDEPNRVGQHGVFGDGDPVAVVRLIDEAYEQALSGTGTRTEREGDRTVYTVDLGRRVGYIGGQSGNRRNRPPAEHVRLVVEGDRLITAFPVRP